MGEGLPWSGGRSGSDYKRKVKDNMESKHHKNGLTLNLNNKNKMEPKRCLEEFQIQYHVGHVVESRVFPVGGALIGEQPVSVCIRKTSRSWLSPPTSRRAPSSGSTDTQTFLKICFVRF